MSLDKKKHYNLSLIEKIKDILFSKQTVKVKVKQIISFVKHFLFYKKMYVALFNFRNSGMLPQIKNS